MSFVYILTVIGTGSIAVVDAIAKGSFGKIGANIVENLPKLISFSQNTKY